MTKVLRLMLKERSNNSSVIKLNKILHIARERLNKLEQLVLDVTSGKKIMKLKHRRLNEILMSKELKQHIIHNT